MIWNKTEAGREELRHATLIQKPAARNLLMIIDGSKSEEMLLKYTIGISAQDFKQLQRLGLIEPSKVRATVDLFLPPEPIAPGERDSAEESAKDFSRVLSDLVSSHLGLTGLAASAAIRNASTMIELREVAQRILVQIRSRKGDEVARQAQKKLFG